MKKYCKYCYKETQMILEEGAYWECQECGALPIRES